MTTVLPLFETPGCNGVAARQGDAAAGEASPAAGIPALCVSVFGLPAPQGSKSFKGITKAGKAILRESSIHVKPWRDNVRADAILAVQAERGWSGPLDCPLLVDMVFTFTRPRSHYRTGRNAHLLRDGAPPRPSGMPDLSKLARSTEDALKDAGVYADDARIVEYGRLAKVYVGGDRDALPSPGAVIRIWRIGDDNA